MSRTGRFEELDALRGLAALVVFLYHCVFLLRLCPPWLGWVIKTPLGLLVYGGHQAVILFFVLSGFVLYLPYTRTGYRVTYAAFVAKRICRIYLPYLGALIFFVLAYVIFFKAQRPANLSDLYGWRVLSLTQQLALLRDHILFLGFYHRDYWNGSTWTLTEEMRISLIYPLLAIMIGRLRSRTSLILALTCSAAVSIAIRIVHHRTPFEPFHYAGLFVLGAVLASKQQQLINLWRRAGRFAQGSLTCAAVLTASYALLLSASFPKFLTEEVSDWLIAVSVSVFLVAALAETWFTSFLLHRLMVHLGRISYGFYLLHLPILFVFVNLLWTRVPALIVFSLSLCVTLALAQIFYLYLERPSMALGKRLAHALQRQGQRELKPVFPAATKTEPIGVI